MYTANYRLLKILQKTKINGNIPHVHGLKVNIVKMSILPKVINRFKAFIP